MEIANLTAHRSAITLIPNSPVLKLQPGQILSATVQAKLTNNLMELLINNQRIQARSNQPFEVGQKLQLVVEKNTNPVILKAVHTPQQNPQAELQAVRHDLLKTHLPRTASFEPLIKTLNSVLQNTQSLSTLPKPLQQTLQSLLSSLSQPQQLSNKEGLKQAIKQSGLFLEAHLSKLVLDKPALTQGKVLTPNSDFKANLLKLAALLTTVSESHTPPIKQAANIPTDRPPQATQQRTTTESPVNQKPVLESKTANQTNLMTPQAKPTVAAQAQHPLPQTDVVHTLDRKEIAKQIEQALSKIQLQQNNAIAIDKQELPQWNMTLPLLDKEHIDQLELNIYQDRTDNESSEHASWNIELLLEMANLGNIHARLHLSGDKLRTSLWAEDSATLKLIEDNISLLQQQLSNTGLKISNIQTFSGQPEPKNIPQPKHKLVDVHL